MQSRGRVSSLVRPFCLCALLFVCSAGFARGENRQSRVVCREDFALSRRSELSGKLRKITGWKDLEFLKNGSLTIGSGAWVGGSESARALLSAAITGDNVLILEDASNRSDVAFGRVIPGRWKNPTSSNGPVYVVLIDFSDFDHLLGDRAAQEAFNSGWGLLHEIDHVVNNSIDSEVPALAGVCEDHINRMRRELNLPERAEYFYTMLPQTESSEFRARFVRMPFDWSDPQTRKHRRYWLMWDATVVGGLIEAKEIAKSRS